MASYLLNRIASSAFTLFAVAIILFVIFRLMPGDPTAQVISPALDAEAQARLRQAFGLDAPLWEQFLLYLKNMVTLEWGRSFTTGERVSVMIGTWLNNTLLLMTTGLALAIGLGTIIGIFIAAKRGSVWDNAATVVALVLQAAPPFVVGILLLIGLSYNLGLFPTGGMFPPGQHPGSVVAMLFTSSFYTHLALPTLTVAGLYLAPPMLIMRDSMLEVLGSDYVEYAKAKGLSSTRILFAHAARNALLAVVTISSLMVGFAIGGQVVIETVFSWPGMGKAMVDAALRHDYPVAQASFFMLAVVVVVLNIITDLSYFLLDPRISVEKS